MIYLNFFNNKLFAFLNINDMYYEVTIMNYALFNYNFINIFNKLLRLFSKKKIARNYLSLFLNKLLLKNKVVSLVVLDNVFTSFYRNFIKNINLPIISFALPNVYNNIVDYPIYINNITVFHKYFFMCEVYNIYSLAQFNYLKSKLFIYFKYLFLLLK